MSKVVEIELVRGMGVHTWGISVHTAEGIEAVGQSRDCVTVELLRQGLRGNEEALDLALIRLWEEDRELAEAIAPDLEGDGDWLDYSGIKMEGV